MKAICSSVCWDFGRATEARADHLGRIPRANAPSAADPVRPSTRRVPRCRRGGGWDALAGIEVFVCAVEAELEAMDRERAGVHAWVPLRP